MSTPSEIKSLVSLLDDPDPYVQSEVKNRLFELGEQAVPLLDQRKNEARDESEKELINEVIRWITYGSLEEDFLEILQKGINRPEQLEAAVLTLCRFSYPTLREKEYEKKLDRFAGMVENRIRYSLSESQKMHKLLNFVFEELKFTGSNEDYYHPQNSYLNRVIDRRKGLPISLGLIVLFLARRLDLPFYGVNMPIHFMLKYKGEKEEVLIDPFDRGKTVTYNQCYYFLKQNGLEPRSEHFEITSERDILARCIRNLVHSYSRREENDKVEQLRQLLGLVNG